MLPRRRGRLYESHYEDGDGGKFPRHRHRHLPNYGMAVLIEVSGWICVSCTFASPPTHHPVWSASTSAALLAFCLASKALGQVLFCSDYLGLGGCASDCCCLRKRYPHLFCSNTCIVCNKSMNGVGELM